VASGLTYQDSARPIGTWYYRVVAVDTAGNVYVADQLSYVVQKFTAAGAFETQWGSYGGGHGQSGVGNTVAAPIARKVIEAVLNR